MRPLSLRPLPAAWLAFVALAAATLSPKAATASEELWALLKKPGHIVLLRHSNAPGSMPESDDMDFKDCKIQRNLDDEGRKQAARLGDAFRKRGIKPVQIVSSRYCRAIETGKLMKLGPVKENPIFNQVFLANPVAMSRAGTQGAAFLKTIKPNQLTIVVSHVTNIQAIGGGSLSSGEMAIVHFDKEGKLVADGKIMVP
jgi:phosphohistidine phosphatase SixA